MPAFFFVMNLPAAFRFITMALAMAGSVHAGPVTPRVLLLDGAYAANDIVLVGERGTIFRSNGLHQDLRIVPAPTTATLTGVTFAGKTAHGWAVGHDALIVATTDAGTTWQKQWQGENLQDSFLDVLALDEQHVIAIGAYGLFVSTADGGKTWARRKITEEDFHLNRLTRGPGGDLYIAGEHGTLLRSSDHGATWQRIDSPYDGSFYGILPLDASTLLAYGLRGRIYRSEDNGASWAPVANEQRVLIATAVKLSNGFIVFAGQSRAGFISRDGGKSVAPWTTNTTSAIAELIALSDGSILALGEAGAQILPKP